MPREASQERVDKAIGACPVCQWPYGSGSIFCSSCGIQLVRLEVFPKPNELLTLFEGYPVIMRFENTGKIPVELERLDGVEWGEWVSETNWPASLDPKEKIEIRRLHTERRGQRGRLTLHPTLLPISFRYRVQKAPRIWLTDEQGREFEQGTDGAQLWAVNREAQWHYLALHTTSEVILAKPPRLFKGDQMVDIVPAEEVSYPFRLDPDKAFPVRLTQNQPLPEEGHPVHLVFPIQNIGDVDFHLNLKYTLRPVLRVEFKPRGFTGDTALISGSRKQKNVSATITHLRGAPLRINAVTSDTSWLQIVDSKETPVVLNPQNSTAGADEESVLNIQLQMKTVDIPRVTESKHFEPKIVVKGEAIGAEDSAFEKGYSLPVGVVPPKPLDHPIGIDFGTTNSCLAYYVVEDEETMPRLAEFESNDPRAEVPTVFQLRAIRKRAERLEILGTLEADEHHLVATENEEAIMSFGRKPFDQVAGINRDNFDGNDIWNSMSSICWNFKYALNRPYDPNIYIDTGMSGILINGHRPNTRNISLTPVDQVAIYLRFMVERFIEESGYLPKEIFLTYPAVFNRQKQALQDAAEKALQERDIETRLEISEPEAIAVYYVWQLMVRANKDNMEEEPADKDDVDERIIGVFDCGGGTTDISIVRYTMGDGEYQMNQVEILGSDGDNRLGGNLLTFCLAKYFYGELVPEQYRSRFPFPKDLRDGLRTQEASVKTNFLKLYQLAEMIKTNSTTYERFQGCFSPQRYEELNQIRDVGLLDLLASGEKLNWPSIELASLEESDVFRVNGLKRSINNGDLPRQLSSMDYQAIFSVLRRELERGFKKLDLMQKELYKRKIISNFQLDHLILAGNSSKLPIVNEIAQGMETKEVSAPALSSPDFNNERKVSVAAGAALYGRSLLEDQESPLEVSGIHKLNYPLGSYNTMRGFRPIFDRWLSLEKGKVHSRASKIISKRQSRTRRILLFEFFGWNYKNLKADRQQVAAIPMPLEERSFKQAAYWQYKLELRGDENNRGQLYYNFAVGQEKDGSDFEEIYDGYLKCEDFNYS